MLTNKENIVVSLIGGAPSSGSTFLADLLDSTVYSACGVELNIFSNKKIYDFCKYKKNIRQGSILSSVYACEQPINFYKLPSYGLDEEKWSKIVQSCGTINDFAEKLAEHFFSFRGKEQARVFFDKTPENINCLREFLNNFQSSYFIHIVRNPLYVYRSLVRRNNLRYVSLIAWLIDVAKYFKYKGDKRVIVVRYEDLVKNPYTIVRDILRLHNITNISEAEIENNYKNNIYRKTHARRQKDWEVQEYGVIANANKKVFGNEELIEMAGLLKVKVNSEYAYFFDIAEISFIDAIKELGYYEEVVQRLSTFENKACFPKKMRADYKRLFSKWLRDAIRGDAGLSALKFYLHPVEKIM